VRGDCQLSLAIRGQSEKQNISSLLNIAWSPFIFSFLFTFFIYISIFFAASYGFSSAPVAVLEGATGCSNLLFAN